MPQRLPYTPSNYLNIYNLLSQVSEERFQDPIQFEKYIHKKQSSPSYIAGNGIYTNITLLDLSDSTLEKLSCENQLSFTFPSFDIEVRLEHDNTRPHTISIKNGLTLPIKNMDDVNFFNAYFRTMKIIRDWLAQDKLTAYVLFNNNYHKIPNNVWVTDENWYRLLADGQINECIPSVYQGYSDVKGVIFFHKSDVARLLCKTSSLDQALYRYSDEEDSIKALLQKNPRAALRLLLICLNEQGSYAVNLRDQKMTLSQFILEGKKDGLVHELHQIAKANNIEVIKNIQLEISNKDEASLDLLNETSVSNEDIKAIATILRHLKKQKGQQKK